MKIFAQKLLVGRTFLANQTVTVEDGQITAIGGGGPADFSVWALTPGLVDLHCHGGQGFDPELNERPLPEFLTILLCHGVTDVLLTLGAEPLPTMRRALAVVQTAMQQQAAGKLPGAHILGVHLEGPFLSPERPGAMPPAALLPPTLAAYQTLVQGYESVIRQVTLAPELPGALELGAALAARGIRVQAGHTDADYETAQRAFSAGFTGLCHTFNACRPLRHRDPGVVAAALLDPNVTTECICDLVHLHPAALQLVYHWSNHAALADALAETGVTVQDPHGLLPLPAGTLFIARASGTGTGVTEGDRITESFAPLAARRLGGQCAVYHTVEELPELADVCAAAPAVVFAFGTREEAAAAAQAAEALAAHNPRFCAVCLAEPDALQHYPFAASTVSAWDRTEPAMRAVCRALANPQI